MFPPNLICECRPVCQHYISDSECTPCYTEQITLYTRWSFACMQCKLNHHWCYKSWNKRYVTGIAWSLLIHVHIYACVFILPPTQRIGQFKLLWVQIGTRRALKLRMKACCPRRKYFYVHNDIVYYKPLFWWPLNNVSLFYSVTNIKP